MTHYFEEPTNENPNFPCGICNKNININHKAIRCSICNYKIHIKCNTFVATFEKNINNTDQKICLKCREEIIPSQKISDEQFYMTAEKCINNDVDLLNMSLLPNNSLKTYFKDINNINSNVFDNDIEAPDINCNYVDINSFNYKNKKNTLSLFHLNIASLKKNKDELETVLNLVDLKFDVVGITETKLKSNIDPTFDININGYKSYSTPSEANKGGALLYIADQFNVKPLTNLNKIMYKSNQLESVFVEICNKNKKNVIIGCIYRHPSMDLDEFNDDFFNLLLENIASDKKLFLIGDFNIDLLKVDIDSPTTNFFDIITSNLLVPHILQPTRITSSSRTLIDNIYSNSSNFEDGISGNLTLAISDHLAQFLIIPEDFQKTPATSNFYKRDLKNFDRENFLLDLLAIDWDEVIAIENNNPNESFNSFFQKIDVLVDTYIPLKKLTKNEIKSKFKPWITSAIRNSMKRRDKFYKKFIKAKNADIKIEYEKLYKDLRNRIVQLCRVSKKTYFQNYFTNNASNIKNTWKGINQIINVNKKGNKSPSSLIVNNKLISDPSEVANKFNEYFSTIAEKLQSKIYHTGTDFMKYLSNINDDNFFIIPTHPVEIIETINDLNSNKSTGPNSIPNEIIDLIKINIADPLSKIVNLSFVNALYFDNLKVSKAIPVFKDKGSLLDCSNYRPISLLSNINKIFEKLMYKRLYSFLSKHNCIYINQLGFRKNHSTIHALISLTDHIRYALDNNNLACGIFIDLQKAFDTVDHKILLKKLAHYGVRGLANDWFKSYLSNRHQFVSINGHESSKILMKHGVPQGSVLGPLLFLIYINDLHNSIKYCKFLHFADDTNLIFSNKSPKLLQNNINFDLRWIPPDLKPTFREKIKKTFFCQIYLTVVNSIVKFIVESESGLIFTSSSLVFKI